MGDTLNITDNIDPFESMVEHEKTHTIKHTQLNHYREQLMNDMMGEDEFQMSCFSKVGDEYEAFIINTILEYRKSKGIVDLKVNIIEHKTKTIVQETDVSIQPIETNHKKAQNLFRLLVHNKIEEDIFIHEMKLFGYGKVAKLECARARVIRKRLRVKKKVEVVEIEAPTSNSIITDILKRFLG